MGGGYLHEWTRRGAPERGKVCRLRLSWQVSASCFEIIIIIFVIIISSKIHVYTINIILFLIITGNVYLWTKASHNHHQETPTPSRRHQGYHRDHHRGSIPHRLLLPRSHIVLQVLQAAASSLKRRTDCKHSIKQSSN